MNIAGGPDIIVFFNECMGGVGGMLLLNVDSSERAHQQASTGSSLMFGVCVCVSHMVHSAL